MFIIVVAPFTFIRQLLGTIMHKKKTKTNIIEMCFVLQKIFISVSQIIFNPFFYPSKQREIYKVAFSYWEFEFIYAKKDFQSIEDLSCNQEQPTTSKDSLEVLIGSITGLRSKKIKEALNGFIQDI